MDLNHSGQLQEFVNHPQVCRIVRPEISVRRGGDCPALLRLLASGHLRATAMAETRTRNSVCPFCSLLCDDLEVLVAGTRLRVLAPDCPQAAAGFAASATPRVRIRGRPADYREAVAEAARLLAASRLPLFAGLGCEGSGMRAALALARATGAVLDHLHGDTLFANLRPMARQGWVTATLAEIRNRADLLLFFGTDGRRLAPRLHERLRIPRPGVRLIYLGEDLEPGPGGEFLPCPRARLHDFAAALRARLRGRRVAADGEERRRLDDLAGALRAARYAVIVWAAGAFPAATAELTVAGLAGLLRDLNATTRAVGLPLAAGDGLSCANTVTLWQTGVPLRTRLAPDGPEHEPRLWRGATLCEARRVDALLWISALSPIPPPGTDLPTIALLHPDAQSARPAAVEIAVGVPGLDHGGFLDRTDGVVSLPLKGLRSSPLPPVARVLDDIRAALAA